jgi:hypothetical protein
VGVTGIGVSVDVAAGVGAIVDSCCVAGTSVQLLLRRTIITRNTINLFIIGNVLVSFTGTIMLQQLMFATE